MKEADQLKILAIIPSGFCFGLQHITVDFFSRFPSNIKSHFLLTRWTNGEMETFLKANNIPYSFSWLGMFSRKMDFLNVKMSLHAITKLPKLYYDFLRVKRKVKPDILYFANHHELILLYPILIFNKIPVVCHMHDPSPDIPFQRRTFKKYEKLVNSFVAVSENVKMRTIALGCDPAKIRMIHNGIEVPDKKKMGRSYQFAKKAMWPEDSFIIGITGQMTVTKGHMDLLEAFRLAYSSNPRLRLVIGGKQQQPLFNLLKEKIEVYGMKELVYFPGWLDEVSVFFENIDLFVLASRHEEGYGLVVAQAMANSLPVIITESGGAVEIVVDSNSGFIVAKNDIKAMSERILLLSVDDNLRKKMSANAYQRVLHEFNINSQSEELADYLTFTAKNVRQS